MQLFGAGTGGSRSVELVTNEEDDDENDADYVDEEEDDDDDVDYWSTGTHTHWDRTRDWWPKITEPQEEGMSLLMSGEFGRVQHQLKSRSGYKNVARNLLNRSTSARPTYREDITSDILPNSSGTAVAAYPANAYVGQFSSDSAFYYTCVRNFRLHVYDMKAPFRQQSPARPQRQEFDDGHTTTMQVIKTIQAAPGRWTITDSHLSPDNQRMIYASISSTVYMTSTLDSSTEQIPISFRDPAPQRGRRGLYSFDDEDQFGIWSCKFSADGKEVIAGGSSMIFVYDLIADKRTVKIAGHTDDVNSCCWADTASGNVLISASDDTFVKVWDRRSLAATRKPSGVLIGHTEGITYVSAKGDGRYVISNGKDQILRLWDLRMMRSDSEFESVAKQNYGIPHFDYRGENYPRPRYKAHPLDCSVMKFTGHEVLRTLIRCHFSPAETTGQQYIYSGSSDGRIHIWSLDGRVVEVLDRSYTLPMALDPSGPDPTDITPARVRPCVRDVSWHSQQPILMSTGWLGRRWGLSEGSVIARHEFKGLSKLRGGLEDWVAKERAERAERAQRRASGQRGMPGAFDTGDAFDDMDTSDGEYCHTMVITGEEELKTEEKFDDSIPPLSVELKSYGFPHGYFMLRCIGAARILDVARGSIEDGTDVILWPPTDSSQVESMRRPESNNQVFFIDTSGALSSRHSGHAIDVEREKLVLRHRRPISHPFPNAYSHPLPRFVYHPETKEITIVFGSGPSDPASRRNSSSSTRKEKTYYLTSVPVRRPPSLMTNASNMLNTAIAAPLAFFGGKGGSNATPEQVFDGEIDLTENEIAEQDRNEAEEIDDSIDALRPVKVIALTAEEAGNASEQAKLRRQWEILPLRISKHRTGMPSQ
ncbi:WD40 repeat-like protein [Trametes coccinea BRFM310]|uniref:WD40 repeat-like protein n=1 Tax=Trametes coccinea (strain BRFM310) TaxID=1353009 RepID=A0A1Y2IPZ2_TRAC3|nr:WD40 repeat-like protein [Trametes coccinea BRFM310]